jgi:hypothetical protein
MKIKEFQQFMIKYFNGDFPNQRLGQAFLNTHYPKDICPEIFYATDIHEAAELIYQKYIKNKA